jgi:hypothetical protein
MLDCDDVSGGGSVRDDGVDDIGRLVTLAAWWRDTLLVDVEAKSI